MNVLDTGSKTTMWLTLPPITGLPVGVIAIGPPLTISAAQIGTIVDTIREAIRKTG